MDSLISITVAVVGIVGAFLWGVLRGRKQESKNAAAKQAKADAITHTKAKEARDEVSGMSDDAVRSRLRERANRQRNM